jgi:hydrogenase maturation protease
MTALVLGVGNPMRRDDGLAHAVLAEVRARAPGTDVREVYGDPASLVTAWSGADVVVLVDAVSGVGEPGEVRRFARNADGWDVVPPAVPLSSHGWSLADALELAEALGRVPSRLVLVGVVAADLATGPGLSAAVAAAVGPAAALVLAEVATD